MKTILKNLETIIGLSADDVEIIKEAAPKLAEWGPAVVQLFYDTLYAYEPTAKVFKEGERPAREASLADWYMTLLRGEVDDAFWWQQWMVGLIHVWRGVPNHYMHAMMSKVQLAFLHLSLQEFETAQAEKIFGAFKRITDVIVGLITESYLVKYLEAVENFSGIKQTVIDRMVSLEVESMIKEYREGK